MDFQIFFNLGREFYFFQHRRRNLEEVRLDHLLGEILILKMRLQKKMLYLNMIFEKETADCIFDENEFYVVR